MNAPETKVLERPVPQFLLRQQPARFVWWTDRSLMISKGDEAMTLDAADIRALARFVKGCNSADQL